MQTEALGETLDDMDREPAPERELPPAAEPFVPATLPDVAPLPAPGIYFGMPFEQYRALPALGSHGIGDIMASPMLFYSRHEWLSEIARKQAAKPENPASAMTKLIGHAYHCRILEGREAYAAQYACELAPEDCKGAIESTDEIKAAIKALGSKPVGKVPDELPGGTAYERAAKKDDWIDQLEALDKAGQFKIMARLVAAHRQANAGKQFLPFDAHEQIEIAAAMIEADPEARKAFRNGYPEVTLIWHCRETGVPMKARVDYLKLKAAVDLKSFDARARSPEEAIKRTIAGYHYNIQPSVYLEAITEVRRLAAQSQLRVFGERSLEQRRWVEKWAAETEEAEWWWVFQAKGFAPITRLVRYHGGLSARRCTDEIVRQAKARFKQYSETFGTEPWVDTAPPWDITDDEIFDSACRI